jgi:hypothetical protein
MTLVKAALQAVGPGAQNPPPTKGDPIAVQLNPTSLRYQLNNNVDVGKAFGRSASQAQGSSSATLQFDLIFDTADEGSTDNPVDVRSKTKKLEQFLLPDKKSPKSAPPRVKFTYGTFSVVGVMSALNQDFDLFAESGVPLRAKLSVTIKEQKPEFDAGETGAGANTGAAAKPMPGSGAGGGAPAAPADRTGTALAGESAADFAARMGLDPAAWKSFAAGLGDTLSLTAGLRIDFSASAGVTLGGGLGEQAGATAGVGGGGRGGSGGGSRGGSRDVTPAEAAAAGGVAKAIEGRAAAASVQEADATRQAFASPAPASPAPASRAPASAATAGTGAARPAPAAPAPQPPKRFGETGGAAPPDGRAVSYGKGVPLRPRVGAPDQRVEPLVVHTRCGKREAS